MERKKRTFLEKRSTRVGAAISVLALASGVLGACGENIGENTCTSTFRESNVYPGDPAAQPDNRDTWKTGILATTELPADAESLVVAYRHPDASNWTDMSYPVDAGKAQKVALLIGDGPVVFSTAVVAPDGSPACNTPPNTAFSSAGLFEDFKDQGATLPEWHN